MIVFADGFDYYNTNAYFLTLWTGGSDAPNATGTGRFGVGRNIPAGSEHIKAVAQQATYIATGAFKLNSIGAISGLINFHDTVGGVIQVHLDLTAGGFLQVLRGSTVLGTATTALFAGIWYHVQMKVKVDPSVGTYEVRIDGNTTPFVSGSGANTRNSANSWTDEIGFGSFSFGLWDDCMILDTTGSFNNDFPGDCKITTVFPTSNGATNNFTPLSGSNFSNVNENPQDNDTTYNFDSTPGDIDLYNFTAISTTGSILAVKNNLSHRKDDAGARIIASQCKSGATSATGASKTCASTYKTDSELYESDPNTTLAWTQANLNAAQFGAKVIS